MPEMGAERHVSENRFRLAVGLMPDCAEAGSVWGNYGRGFDVLDKDNVAEGHIRCFTPNALRDIAAACGFRVAGWWKQSLGLTAKAGSHIGAILTPR